MPQWDERNTKIFRRIAFTIRRVNRSGERTADKRIRDTPASLVVRRSKVAQVHRRSGTCSSPGPTPKPGRRRTPSVVQVLRKTLELPPHFPTTDALLQANIRWNDRLEEGLVKHATQVWDRRVRHATSTVENRATMTSYTTSLLAL